MKRIFFSVVCFFLVACATAPVSSNQFSQLDQIAHEFWEQTVKQNPTWATYIGDHRYDHLLPNWTPEARKKYKLSLQTLNKKLLNISPEKLSPQQISTFSALKHQLDSQLAIDVCKNENWVVDQLEGPQIWLADLPSYQVIKATEDAVNLITRYHRVGDFFDVHIQNLRTGLAENLTSPRKNVELVIAQLDFQLAQGSEKSPFLKLTFDSEYGKSEKEAVVHEAEYAVKHVIWPALQSYRDFLQTEILPAAREISGISGLPEGDRCYAALIENHTGLKSSAAEIHKLGQQEVRRIKSEMEVLAKKTRPELTFSDFLAQLRTDPAQFAPDRKALIRHNEDLLKRAKMALNDVFFEIPKTPVAIKPMETFREKEAPAAYYFEATGDADSSAYYYLNTYKANERPLYNMAALAFHEAVPGHHFQIALNNENKSLPMFQRKLGHTAFIEGWALYAESLAGEMGLYHTPEEKMGALNYELWRALRLVVDTGIHAQSWSRAQSIDYLATETALPPHEVENEIDRYIIWPGQALAYKIGQLTISDLRQKAKTKLGKTFSVKAFHDQVLKNGPIPLGALKTNLDRWMNGSIRQSS